MNRNRTEVTVHTGGVFSVFEQTARRRAGHVALRGRGGQGVSLSYGEVLNLVQRLAAGFQSPRFAEFSYIGLLSENRPEWPIAYLAIVAAGKTVVPIDANLKANEMEAIIGHSGISMVVASGRYERLLAEMNVGLDIYSFESESPHYWDELMSEPGNLRLTATRDTVAALIYTSGTTGTPKAVTLTHGNLLANLTSIRSALEFGPEDVFLSILPLHHTFEATCGFLTPLTTGSTVIYARSLKSKDIMEDIAGNDVTVMCGVPLLYEKMYMSIQRRLLQATLGRKIAFRVLYALSAAGWWLGRKWGGPLFKGLRGKAGLDGVRMFVSGGAALPPSIARFFNLIGFTCLQGYGMTECSPVISVNRPQDIEFGSVGAPLDGVEVRIDNPDESGIGEICVKGGNVTPGYRDNPEKTAELIRGDWLYTGDLGRYVRGHLWITGRAKNLIVSAAGKNIYPEELEERAIASHFILEAVVFGRRREGRQGEDVWALLVPDLEQFAAEFGFAPDQPDRAIIAVELEKAVAEINRQVADYKRIAGFDWQLEELEKTSTKKIKRSVYNKGSDGVNGRG